MNKKKLDKITVKMTKEELWRANVDYIRLGRLRRFITYVFGRRRLIKTMGSSHMGVKLFKKVYAPKIK